MLLAITAIALALLVFLLFVSLKHIPVRPSRLVLQGWQAQDGSLVLQSCLQPRRRDFWCCWVFSEHFWGLKLVVVLPQGWSLRLLKGDSRCDVLELERAVGTGLLPTPNRRRSPRPISWMSVFRTEAGCFVSCHWGLDDFSVVLTGQRRKPHGPFRKTQTLNPTS